MQTVDKAMSLLNFFSVNQPEIGLNELSRLADLDRAAARRYLIALSKHGLIEQNSRDRKYRLGSAHLRLARVREATVPFNVIVQPVLEALALNFQETAHAAIYSEGKMVTVAIAEPDRATRVRVDPVQPLPLHATASGIAYLAHLEDSVAAALLKKISLKRHTTNTATTRRDLTRRLEETRKWGCARGESSFEDEVIGTAAPIFDAAGRPIATIAVAAVASRFNQELGIEIGKSVLEAADYVTSSMGGTRRK